MHARFAGLFAAQAFDFDAAGGQGFAQQLRRLAKADAAAVRWADESNQRYLLVGSDCLPQELTEKYTEFFRQAYDFVLVGNSLMPIPLGE